MSAVRAIAFLVLLVPSVLALLPVINTKSGKVRGQQLNVYGKPVNEFLGIPFAEPPIGDLRFKKPVPVTQWTSTLEAAELSSSCMQVDTLSFRKFIKPIMELSFSEDCLYLNIWAPKVKNESELKPVLVWFHGGSFSVGTSNLQWYDGAVLSAAEDVVVVTINYRVGFLGFFTSKTTDAPGNIGLYDQTLALKWISENIKAFGGNPSSVTLFGESAGSFSVAFHIQSPISQGLFHRGIMQSGGIYTPMVADNAGKALLKGNELAKLVGCSRVGHDLISNPGDVVECLRTRSAEELILAQGELSRPASMHFLPVYDEEFLPLNPNLAADRGLFANVELLIGHNKDEGSWFMPGPNPEKFPFSGPPGNVTIQEARDILDDLLKMWGYDNTRDILDYYFNSLRPEDYDGIRAALISAVGDYIITCPSVFSAERHTLRTSSVYYYVFTHRSEKCYFHEWMGVPHTAEIQFVFGVPHRHPQGYTDVDRGFSLGLMKIWAEFARTGKPPKVNSEEWPVFKKQQPAYLDLSAHTMKVSVLPEGFCDFWRKYL